LYSLLSFLTFFFSFPPSPSVLSTENPSSSVEKQETNDHAPNLSCKRRRGWEDGGEKSSEASVNDEEDDDGAPPRLQLLAFKAVMETQDVEEDDVFFPLAIRILV